jgi:hypothetical protein
MKTFALAIAAAAVAVVALPASATTVVDQSQVNASNDFAYLNYFDIASQSFTAGYDNTVGAGVFLSPRYGSTANVTLKILSGLPSSGAQVIATGTARGTAGNWVDVSWTQAALVVGQKYWLSATADNVLVVAATASNAYARGNAYYSASPYSSYDIAFRTYANDAVAAVPEAGTWGMMIAGFGVMGFSLRRRSKVSTAVRFA